MVVIVLGSIVYLIIDLWISVTYYNIDFPKNVNGNYLGKNYAKDPSENPSFFIWQVTAHTKSEYFP